MLRRLVLGMLVGLIVGGLLAVGLVMGLGLPTFTSAGGAIVAYLTAAFAGVATGLVAGKPIWTSGAKIEAGLKAFFGALLGAGLMFALRRWGGSFTLDLPPIGANGPTAVTDLPAASLPLVAAVLGAFFELDNTAEPKQEAEKGKPGGGARVAADGARSRKNRLPEATESDAEEDVEVAARHAKH